MQNFTFGGNTPWTYEQLQRRRKMAEAMAANMGTPRNVGEGLASIGKALAVRGINKRADAREAELKGDFDADYGALFGGVATAPSSGGSNYADAIASIESAGSGDYSAVGPDTGKGRAYGRYQVMDFNIGPWTKKHLGREMTPQEFLANPQAQDAVFNGEFGGYVQKYGNPQDAASMWFSGRPVAQAGNASDGYTTVPEYVQKFTKALGGTVSTRNSQPNSPGVAAIAKLIGNPAASPGQRAVLNTMLQQQMQANDPMRQLQMEKMQAELDSARNPQTYRQITGEEAAAMGLDPSQVYNLDPKGKVSPVSGGGVTVNNHMGGEKGRYIYGKDAGLPSGWRFDTETQQAEAVPGGPEDTTKFDEKAKVTKETQANLVLDEISIARDLIQGESITSPATGITGSLASNIDSTRAGSLKNRLTTIKANIGFDKLQAMRDASPTGGALGQVSEFENRLLQAVFGSLEQAQKSEDILYNLERLEGIYNRIIHEGIGDDEARKMYREIATGQTPEAPTGRGKVAEKQTGSIDFSADKPPSGLSGDDADLWKYATPEERKAIWGQ